MSDSDPRQTARGGFPNGLLAVAMLAAIGVISWVTRDAEPTVRPAPVVPAAVQTDGRPNILFIVWDTTRADRMSLYGYDPQTTPRLDAMASDALVFDQARAPGIWTLPSHASMFTGLSPQSTGADERWMWLDHQHLTLAEWLADQGYVTMSFAANPLLCAETNLVQGFDRVLTTWHPEVSAVSKEATRRRILDNDASNELAPKWKPPEHGATNAEWARAAHKDASRVMSQALLRWIDNRRAPEPWFVFLNFMEAHTPRNPSVTARKAMMGEETHAHSLTVDQAHINLHFYNFGKRDYSAEDLEAIGAVYDATLFDLDGTTGLLLDGLRERGALENTLVVLTSDHGENLGDHHLFNHRFTLADSLTHVPLVLMHPSIAPGRVSEPVSTTDIFATVADFLEVEPPALPSSSLLGKARSPASSHMAKPLRREIETVAAVYPDVDVEPWLVSGDTWIAEDFKLVRRSDGDRLYNLGADPGELVDVAAEHPDRVQAMGTSLESWLESQPPYDVASRTEADEPRTVRASQAELREAMAALGYVVEDE